MSFSKIGEKRHFLARFFSGAETSSLEDGLHTAKNQKPKTSELSI